MYVRYNANTFVATLNLRKFLDLDSEAGDFQNLISSSMSTDAALVKFS